jgi:hypothetical protein
MNRPLVRALLRGGLFVLDASELVGITSRRVSQPSRGGVRGRRRESGPRALGFAVGIGVGLGLGILFAPASGEQTRLAILQTIRQLRGSWREKCAGADKKPPASERTSSSGSEQREGV